MNLKEEEPNSLVPKKIAELNPAIYIIFEFQFIRYLHHSESFLPALKTSVFRLLYR